MADDGVREAHGVSAGEIWIELYEQGTHIEVPYRMKAGKLYPAQARRLARQLYRLARRIEARNVQ